MKHLTAFVFGIVAATLVFWFVVPHYQLLTTKTPTGTVWIKLNRLSGRTWFAISYEGAFGVQRPGNWVDMDQPPHLDLRPVEDFDQTKTVPVHTSEPKVKNERTNTQSTAH